MDLLLGFKGRLSRRDWWSGHIGLVLAHYMIGFVLAAAEGTLDPLTYQYALSPGAELLHWASLLPLAMVSVSLGIGRCHDRDRDGKEMFWLLVPVAGWGWLVYLLGMESGSPAANRYGPPPP